MMRAVRITVLAALMVANEAAFVPIDQHRALTYKPGIDEALAHRNTSSVWPSSLRGMVGTRAESRHLAVPSATAYHAVYNCSRCNLIVAFLDPHILVPCFRHLEFAGAAGNKTTTGTITTGTTTTTGSSSVSSSGSSSSASSSAATITGSGSSSSSGSTVPTNNPGKRAKIKIKCHSCCLCVISSPRHTPPTIHLISVALRPSCVQLLYHDSHC